jgi:hypothetical protein
MNAAEALDLATAARSLDGEYKREETNEVLKTIKANAKVGNLGCIIYDLIDPIVVNRLRILGYAVRESEDQRDGYMAEITWGKK